MGSKFEIFSGQNSQFYFRLKASNGEIILHSEGYAAKANCQNGIKSVQTNAPDDKHYEKLSAKNGQCYFTLKAANNQVIGISEQYTTAQSRDRGIESVKKNAVTTTIVDLTERK